MPPRGISPWWVPCAPGVRLKLDSIPRHLPAQPLSPPPCPSPLTASSVTHMHQIPASGSAGRDLGPPGEAGLTSGRESLNVKCSEVLRAFFCRVGRLPGPLSGPNSCLYREQKNGAGDPTVNEVTAFSSGSSVITQSGARETLGQPSQGDGVTVWDREAGPGVNSKLSSCTSRTCKDRGEESREQVEGRVRTRL